MIAFCCVSDDHEVFYKRAAPAIQTVIESDSLLMRRHLPSSLAGAVNEMLTRAAEHDDLEGVVLVDQGLDIGVADFLPRVLTLREEHRSTAIFAARRGGAAPEVLATPALSTASTTEAEAIDGSLLVLSPWAARELRLDPRLELSLDDCAVDLCRQARDARRQVAVLDFGVAFDTDIPTYGAAL